MSIYTPTEVNYLYIYTYYNLTISIFILNPPQVSISCSIHPKKLLYFSRTQRKFKMFFYDMFLLFFISFSDNERLSFFVSDEGATFSFLDAFFKTQIMRMQMIIIDHVMDTLKYKKLSLLPGVLSLTYSILTYVYIFIAM